MEYSIHEQKVYNNSSLIVEQKTEYETQLKNRDELLELLDLFMEGGSFHNSVILEKKACIKNKYDPLIKESKRILYNSERRLQYNLNKC